MRLEAVTRQDLALYESMFGDADYMKDLGGPQPADKIPGILERQASCMETGKGWVYKIVAEKADWKKGEEDDNSNNRQEVAEEEEEEDDVAVGTVCVWTGYDDKRQVEISEMGYGVMVKYQGHGFASQAVKMVLDLAKESQRWGVIHCYTNINNLPSIRLCEKLGFSLLEECEMEYDGRYLPAKHFTYDTSVKA